MITRFRVHNFKTFLNFEVDLRRRHLIVGKNNSGKTNFCHALRFLGATASNPFSGIRIPGGPDAFCHWEFDSRHSEFECTCELRFEGSLLTFHYRLHLRVEPGSFTTDSDKPPFSTLLESLTVKGDHWPDVSLLQSDGNHVRLLHEEHYLKGGDTKDLYVETGAPRDRSMLFQLYELPTNRRATLFKRFLGSISYYCLSPPLMRYGWTSKELMGDGGGRILAPHGQNLPLILFQLKNEDEPRYREVLELVSQIEPSMDSLGFYALPDNTPVPYVFLKGRRKVSWDTLSDGSLCILGLAAVLTQAERVEETPGWPGASSIIEEPENSLFRGVLQSLWDNLSALAPGSQTIFTSHSPYFLDLFDRDLACVTRFRRDGSLTTTKNLDDFADTIAHYRQEYDLSLGEQLYKEVFE